MTTEEDLHSLATIGGDIRITWNSDNGGTFTVRRTGELGEPNRILTTTDQADAIARAANLLLEDLEAELGEPHPRLVVIDTDNVPRITAGIRLPKTLDELAETIDLMSSDEDDPYTKGVLAGLLDFIAFKTGTIIIPADTTAAVEALERVKTSAAGSSAMLAQARRVTVTYEGGLFATPARYVVKDRWGPSGWEPRPAWPPPAPGTHEADLTPAQEGPYLFESPPPGYFIERRDAARWSRSAQEDAQR